MHQPGVAAILQTSRENRAKRIAQAIRRADLLPIRAIPKELPDSEFYPSCTGLPHHWPGGSMEIPGGL